MIFQKLLSLSDLYKTQAFYVYKEVKVVMVCENKDLMFAIFYIVLPVLEGLNDD